ncbi:serpentine type 7TM GPCR chemoreceptor srsx domain-containing protein [Ditylenchus destructor]|uniref:Serpentine type 7TM GPCR chemoreceptor srsx domain-containing protein n=1 Tax=Ditylenchus destructor TaxID=166010 RepID=A0AAD4N102_9BILA|nr:serpentine type 7TM GPCR chemoreceptor srsx domain-containing protein [Ditylenchus destructor]
MTDRLYLTYRTGFPSLLFGVTLALYVSAMAGAVCNAMLCYVTLKYRCLNNTYNYLLLLTAIGDICHEISYNVPLIHQLTGNNFVGMLSCFYAQSYAVLGIAISFTAAFLIAFDRLIGVVFPFWVVPSDHSHSMSLASMSHPIYGRYQHGRKVAYIAVLVSLSLAFSSYLFYVVYLTSALHPNWPVVCMYSAMFQGEAGKIIFRSCVLFNFLTMVCYALIWVLLKRSKVIGLHTYKSMRMFQALVTIMCIVLLGWMLNAIIELAIPCFTDNGTIAWFVTRIGAFGINIASGINAPVLYLFSSDYRYAIRKEVRRLCLFSIRKISILPFSNSNNHTQSNPQQNRNQEQETRL